MKSLVTLKNAAKYLNTTKSRILEAIDEGELSASKGPDGWKISILELETWARKALAPAEPTQEEAETAQADINGQLLDRLENAQRRAIFLELQLQQTQRLLCERNEEQHEREARAKEAESKIAEEVKHRRNAERAALHFKSELDSLKVEFSQREIQWAEARRPWYKKLFRKSG